MFLVCSPNADLYISGSRDFVVENGGGGGGGENATLHELRQASSPCFIDVQFYIT